MNETPAESPFLPDNSSTPPGSAQPPDSPPTSQSQAPPWADPAQSEQTPPVPALAPQDPVPPALTGAIPANRPKKSTLPVGWIMIGLLVFVTLCGGSCALLFDVGTLFSGMNQAPMQEVIDKFIRALSQKDIEAAYALMSARAQRVAGRASIETILQGNNFILVRDYESIQIVSRSVAAQANTNPDLPQGRVAQVVGTIKYRDGTEGQFTAILEQDHGEWKIFGVNIIVPPDKFPPLESGS